MTIEAILRLALAEPNRPALATSGERVTYGQLGAAAAFLADRLRHQNLTPGQVVALSLPNGAAFAAALLAGLRAGLRVLLLDPHTPPAAQADYGRRAGAACVLVPEEETDRSIPGLPTLPIPSLTTLPNVTTMTDIPDSAALLLMSSGTSGTPKIVLRTLAQADAAGQAFQATIPYAPDDRVLAMLPFFHSFGLLNVLLQSLAAGAELIVTDFSPRPTARLIEEQAVSVLPATPFMFRLLAETAFRQTPDFRRVRLAISAGSALTAAVAGQFQKRFGVPIRQSFGSTESGPATLTDGLPGEPGSVGRPYHGVTVAALNERDMPQPPGTQGRLAVQSPGNATGYLDAPDATAATFRGVWVLTGDLGHVAPDGNVFIQGRDRPMLNVGGKKVAPADVEACLRAHPCVAHAVVTGDRTDEGDDRIKAMVTPSGPLTVAELRAFCGERLAPFQMPREIVLRRDMERGAMGKPG